MIACILTSALYNFRYVHFYLVPLYVIYHFLRLHLRFFFVVIGFQQLAYNVVGIFQHVLDYLTLLQRSLRLCAFPPPLVLAFRLRFVELIFPLLHTYWSFLPQTIIFSWWQPLNVFFRYCLFYLCSIWVFFFFFFIFLFLLIEKKLIIDSDYRIFTGAADMAHTPFWTCWRKAVVQHKLYCLYPKFRHNWAALFSSRNGGPLLKFKFLDASQGPIKAYLSKNISQAW